ncbi:MULTISPECIES: YIP1 family protein [Falsihalocynthiibacter]|uniref:YIP1 family protein n=1 Tax=Falsihalocynthiibacter TaxID=2854182 RepID=UPI00300156C1
MTRIDIQNLLLLLATKPRVGMRVVLDLGIQGRVLVQLAALVSVLTGIMGFVVTLIAPVAEGVVAPTPTGYVIVAASNIVLSTILFYWAGRTVEGTGTLQDIAMAMIAHQGFMMLLPLIIALASTISPTLSGMTLLIGLPYLLYLMAGFLAEAHKLRSTGMAFLLIVGVLFVLSLVLIFFVSLFGIVPA